MRLECYNFSGIIIILDLVGLGIPFGKFATPNFKIRNILMLTKQIESISS
jgi:hypothetical protein